MVRQLLPLGSLLAGLALFGAEPPPAPGGPLSPSEEAATFRLPKGLHVELVAAEPDVVDPVAIAFDEDDRLFVAEMRGYPNDGVGTGAVTSGAIRMLTDPDDKGRYRKSTVFAEVLRFPTSLQPYKGGLLVSMAPDILYIEDTDGDGKADRQRPLYTGFGTYNIQALVNGLQWGLDNWVYANGGLKTSTVRCAEQKVAAGIE